MTAALIYLNACRPMIRLSHIFFFANYAAGLNSFGLHFVKLPVNGILIKYQNRNGSIKNKKNAQVNNQLFNHAEF